MGTAEQRRTTFDSILFIQHLFQSRLELATTAKKTSLWTRPGAYGGGGSCQWPAEEEEEGKGR